MQKDFGLWLRARREQQEKSRQELATAAGCSIGTVAAAEHGYRISDAMAKKLADALGCKPESLRAGDPR